jgi:outer membrane immunogenic protein
MGSIMKKLLLGTSVVFALALGGPAYSAELPMKAASARPTAAPVLWTWTGFYIGAYGGGGWAREDFDHPYDPTGTIGLPAVGSAPFTGIHDSGAIVGGQFGYNWQPYAHWVMGVEADVSGTTIKKSDTRGGASVQCIEGCSTTTTTTISAAIANKVRDLGTLRGKVGWTPFDNMMVYGTGGLAWGQINHAESDITNETCTGPVCDGFTSLVVTHSFSATTTQFGWAAGVGLDWRIWSDLILGVLYLHYDLGKTTFTTARSFQAECEPTCLTQSVTGLEQFPSAHVTVDAITARLSWLFTMPPPLPVVARY